MCHDDDRQPGPMRARKDFKPTAKSLTSLRQKQGRQNSFIPKNERVKQRPFDEALRAELEWQSQNWKTYWSQPPSSSSSSQQWWQHEPQDSQWRDHQEVERVMATDSWQILCGSHFARFLHIRRFFFTDFAYRRWRLSCTRRGVKTEHLVSRTFFSVL